MSDVKVTLFHDKLLKLDQAAIRALEKTTDALLTEIKHAQVIPFDQGHLQNDSTFKDLTESEKGHTEIVSSTPYARRLYYHPEFHFQTANNPNAKAHWFNDWESGGINGDFAKNAFAKLYKQEAGNGIS